MKREALEQGSANRKTKGLVMALRASTSNISQLRRLEEFCKHMAEYPSTRGKAVKARAIPCLLKLRQNPDQAIQELSMEALSLVGYVDPVKGRGIRLLCLDGGGTRGLVTIEILKQLQECCGQEIHKMFDYVCGVSTGSLLAVMLSAFRVPLPETELLYKQYSSQMFSRNKLMGVGKLFMSHSYYETDVWEKVLHESIGFKTFLESTRDPECPKIGLVSSLMNVTHLQNFFFRNYTLPSGVHSHFPGSCNYALWQGIRASSAAPGYFEEMKLGDWVHQDGGLITNNPTAIALHECRLLWPKEKIQCVVSVGTGKYVPGLEAQPADSASLKTKVTKIVQSATDTEAVHTTLQDLLPPSSYFRLNPYLSQDFQLDEIRKDQWDNMRHDTQMYCRKNTQKIEKAAQILLKTRMPHQKAQDWLKEQRDLL
ncbi:hypothetical protein CAPTEDRAFT_100304 [Capitella teleta]|uniref:PNPLA domain-containing protein n=1 Tax=Capitella teleta TaxID=283909 RepID=R7U8N4_CAPTE|nr:hypothetical protein CAPTEDRAFT_100304 [Capitella teleta]|eukprot:ELU02471.1 hypothetical protein CAPTEDRAFT_100304 [Capitella teleta]